MGVRKLLAGLGGISATGLLAATPALADNSTVDWSGFYLGLHKSLLATEIEDDNDVIGQQWVGSPPDQRELTGVGIGLHAGYNYQVQRLIVGGELDFTYFQTLRTIARGGGTNLEVPMLFSLKGRVGYAFDRVLPFVTAGVGATVINFNNRNGPVSHVETLLSLLVGGGVEYRVLPNASIRGEYIFMHGSKDFTAGAISSDVDTDSHIVQVGISWHLSAEPASETERRNVDWSGFYVGVHAAATHAEIEDKNNSVFDNSPGITDYGFNGIDQGLYIGYNHAWNDLILGIEADVTFGNAGNLLPSSEGVRTDLDTMFSLRGRIGYPIGRLMPYFTAGIAYADLDIVRNSGNNNVFRQSPDPYLGFVLGAGSEFLIAPHVTVRAEYLYYNFGDERAVGRDADDIGKIDLESHTVRFGLAVSTGAVPEDGMEETFDWTGFYVGAHVGMLQTHSSETSTVIGLGPTFDINGFGGGLFGGFNYQIARFVLGIEADITFANFGDNFPQGGERVNVDDFHSVRGRLGYAVGRALPYITGGAVWTELSSDANAFGSIDYAGYTIGAGLEYALTDFLIWRSEYLYGRYDEEVGPTGVRFDLDSHQLRFGLSLLLNPFVWAN